MGKSFDISGFVDAAERLLGTELDLDKLHDLLEREGIGIDLENVIAGSDCLYALVDDNGRLSLMKVKVILHILDKDVNRIDNYAVRTPNDYARLSDVPGFIEELHKYHFLDCRTLQRMRSIGREFRYRLSLRTDGRFTYQLLKNNEIFATSDQQRLLPCQNCLNVFGSLCGTSFNRYTFMPNDFFGRMGEKIGLPDNGYPLESQELTNNVYHREFKKISRIAKIKKKYICEKCGMDLSVPNLKKYLHCHHVNADKSDVRWINLKCVCIKCHAEEPFHGHIKALPKFREFVQIWNNWNDKLPLN